MGSVKPYFSDKSSNSTKITVEKDMIINDDNQIANIMNEHIVTITVFLKNLDSDFFNWSYQFKNGKKNLSRISSKQF